MFTVNSTYNENERMPAKYANEGVSGGENVSPPFSWDNAPEGTKSFALAMVDHHKVANEFVHWLVVNIPEDTTSVKEGASKTDSMPEGSKELNTTYGQAFYGGPRPPSGTGDHPYETTVYALSDDLDLDLDEDVTLDDFLSAVEDKTLAKASLTGMFSQ